VLDEDHRGLGFFYHFFQLQAGIDIYVIERLVPDVEMRLLAEAFGQQQLLLLPGGEVAQVFFQLQPLEA